MCSDKIPIGRVGEQRIDMFEATGLVRPAQRQIFPIPDTRHQLNTEEVCQREYGRVLSLCLSMESVWLNVTLVFEQAIKNVDGFDVSRNQSEKLGQLPITTSSSRRSAF
jgi:hypothetical protein